MSATQRTNAAAASGMIGAEVSSGGIAVLTAPARIMAMPTPISEARNQSQRRLYRLPNSNMTHAVPMSAISGATSRNTPLSVC